jgi:hypothetical protein
LAVRTNPASLRFPKQAVGRETTSVLYRAGNDAVMKKIVRPVDNYSNLSTSHQIEVRDNGQLFNTSTKSGTGPAIYTSGGVELEAVCPKGGSIVARVSDRIWLGLDDRILFSKPINPASGSLDRYAPEFNELFGFSIPGSRRPTGIGDLDGKVVVFTESEIYVITGNGPDAAGNENDFSSLTTIATNTGCVGSRSVVKTPVGLMFKGAAGIYLLDRSLQLTFIGSAVEDTTSQFPYVSSAVLVSEANEIRFTCTLTPPSSGGDAGVIVVYNYEAKAWSVWNISRGAFSNVPFVGACIHKGIYYALDSTGVIMYEDVGKWFDDGDKWITFSASTANFQPAGQSGWARYRSATLLQESRDPHNLTVDVYSGFESTPSQTHTWTAEQLATFPGYPTRQQPKIGIRRQKEQAQRIRWYDSQADTSITGAGFKMSGINIQFGVKKGTVKVSSQQRS